MTPERAMIFAAGFGNRMKHLTREIPKPMVPLAGRPMIDHAVDLLRDAGITRIVANTHYLHDRIAPHLGELGVAVHRETPDILETGGGLRAALPMLGRSPVVTVNPDVAWSGYNPVTALFKAWRSDMQALLMLVPLSRARSLRTEGDFSLEQGEIFRNGPYLYGGVQIIRTDRLAEISGDAFSLNLYWDLLAGNSPLHGLVYEGGWCDIGSPEGLTEAEAMLRNA